MAEDPGPMRERPGSGDVLEFLTTRFSVGPKHLAAPGPDGAVLARAAAAALRAPDHRHLVPFRFAQVADAQRETLAALFEAAARRHGHDPADVAAEGRRAWNGPVLVAVIARIVTDHPEVPEHEQWVCIGGALTNFLNALHLAGFGAKMLSGRKAGDPEINAAFCEPGERLLGWIVAGTPTTQAKPKHEDDASAVLGPWRPARR